MMIIDSITNCIFYPVDLVLEKVKADTTDKSDKL